jgi:predicted membrane-bound spermidine synthase
MSEAAAAVPRWAWLIPNFTVFISSLCIMVVELVAGRLIARHVGSSLYTWTSVIGIVLAGIAAGNYIGGRIFYWPRPPAC